MLQSDSSLPSLPLSTYLPPFHISASCCQVRRNKNNKRDNTTTHMRKLNDNLWSTPFQILPFPSLLCLPPLVGPWLWAERTPFSWVSCCAHISRFVFRSRNAITQPVRSFHRSLVRSLILLLVRSRCSVLQFSFETAFHFSQPTPRLYVCVCASDCLFVFTIYWLIIFISNGISWKSNNDLPYDVSLSD